MRFQVLRYMCFSFFALFAPKIWDHILRKVFPGQFLLLFFKAQKCLETCVNCVWNCLTPLFTSLEVKFSKHIFFKNVLLPHLKRKTFLEGDIWKISRRRITDLRNQGHYKSKFCKKSVGALHLGKMGWQSLLHGQMNLNLGSVWWNIPPRSEEVLKSFISVFYC